MSSMSSMSSVAPEKLERMLEAQLEEDLERIESLLLDATRRR